MQRKADEYRNSAAFDKYTIEIARDMPDVVKDVFEAYVIPYVQKSRGETPNFLDYIGRFAEDYFFEFVVSRDGTTRTPFQKQISKSTRYNKKRKKKEEIQKTEKFLLTGYKLALMHKEIPENSISPFTESRLSLFSFNFSRERDETVVMLKDLISAWSVSAQEFAGSVTKTAEELKETFYGLSNCPVLSVFANREEIEQLILMDIEDCVLRLGCLKKYQDILDYTVGPMKAGSGFIREGESILQKVEKPTALEVKRVTDEAVLNLFFADLKRTSKTALLTKSMVFSAQEWRVLVYLLSKAVKQCRGRSQDRTKLMAVGMISDLLPVAFPERKSNRYATTDRERAVAILKTLQETSLEARFDSKLAMASIVGDVVFTKKQVGIDDDVNTYENIGSAEASALTDAAYVVYFGQFITESFLSGRISASMENEVKSLDNKVAKLLYSALNPMRINDLAFNQEPVRARIITMTDLMAYVWLGGTAPRRRKLFTEALQCLKDNGLVIEEFQQEKRGGNDWHITWLPLTPEENYTLEHVENASFGFDMSLLEAKPDPAAIEEEEDDEVINLPDDGTYCETPF